MNGTHKQKLLQRTLHALAECTLLVEGKHDVKALNEVVPGATCITANGSVERTITTVVASSKGSPVVLLFDFDEEGKRKAALFEERLSSEPVRINRHLRHTVRMLFGIRSIEELPTAHARVLQEIAESRET